MSNGLMYRCPLPASLNGDSCGEANEHPQGPSVVTATGLNLGKRQLRRLRDLASKWA